MFSVKISFLYYSVALHFEMDVQTENCKSDIKNEVVESDAGGYGKKLRESVDSGNVDLVQQILADGVNVDCVDEDGMTPLQHAAYKGNLQLCEMLLAHGADVNYSAHENGYTALMFAALSGKRDVVRLLLEHDACVGLTNSVQRTAAQMAAFIGQHEIVSLINNFFSPKELEYYCQPRGLETEPKLPPSLFPALYRYIINVNLNPVKLSLILRQNIELINNANCMIRVLDLLCEKMMKQRDTNEILAMKFCYLSFVLSQAAKSHEEWQQKSGDGPVLEMWIKYLLKSSEVRGIPGNQDQLVCSMLKEFPYVESSLFQQIVRTITAANATALNVLVSCINGQHFASAEDKSCSTCNELGGKTCQNCKSVFYCDRECQKLHWFVHKKHCSNLAAEQQAVEMQKLADAENKGEPEQDTKEGEKENTAQEESNQEV